MAQKITESNLRVGQNNCPRLGPILPCPEGEAIMLADNLGQKELEHLVSTFTDQPSLPPPPLQYGRPLNEFSNSNIKYQNNEKLCINITHDTNCLYLDMTVLFLMHSSCLIVDVLTFEPVINLW